MSNLVMWNILDSKEGNEELFSKFLDAPKPTIGEQFMMMRDHRGPYEHDEILMISGHVTEVMTTVFLSTSGPSEVHLSIYLDVEEMTKWDAEKEAPYDVDI